MSATQTRGLTPEQVRQFHQDGYLVVEDLIPERLLDAVEDEITGVIDQLAEAYMATGKLSSTYADEPFTTRLTRITAETKEIVSQIQDGALAVNSGGALTLPSIFEIMRCEPLLDAVESLCGPEIIASSIYRLRPKVPQHGPGVVPWHQDSGYFEPYCDKSLILTCWMPLVDATPEMGCMQVMRRGHLGEVVPHGHGENHYLQIAEEDLPTGEIVTVPVRRGGVLLMTNCTPHCSTPNTSDIIRWSMDLRYQSASLPTNAPITRLPEEEEVFDASAPLACYPPEADALIRSRKRPEQVIPNAEEFDRIRGAHKPGAITERWGNPQFWKEGGRRRTGMGV